MYAYIGLFTRKGKRLILSRNITFIHIYKILSNVILGRLTPYVDEIIGDHQCGFRRNRSTIDQIFCKYCRKKWEYNGTVHQLFIDFKKAYDSVKKEVLYNILTEFSIISDSIQFIVDLNKEMHYHLYFSTLL